MILQSSNLAVGLILELNGPSDLILVACPNLMESLDSGTYDSENRKQDLSLSQVSV